MKTPMQEMLEWVRATLPMDLDTSRMIEEKLESLIEKEKEVVGEPSMNMKGYLIKEEQLEKLGDFERMIGANARIIEVLCSEEKDDIVYGFELGKIHSDLRQCYIDMMNLQSEIRAYQTFNTKEK